jgi:DNA polymerase-3 subunit gamma/tau
MTSEQPQKTPYRVLARKYRPRNFTELVGQDALVRTLTNAIESGRIAQAYMLTGVRGVGKTTTARIIARALNYTGPDGKAGPTTGPTDDCAVCQAIAEGRHPDVLEMDAASNNGVDSIRELTDGVRYAPTSARYKVYIIDEVHMLSNAAWNALLKTLEEPPAHVIFIFATTEIRKVPVTVLSRCQRFDLRRIDAPVLAAYYKSICEKEGVNAEDDALAMIARAADGSARDGLSLLDQAIARGNGAVTGEQVRDMIGLADRARVLDTLEHALKGECPEALAIVEDLCARGGEPLTIAQDLLEYAHVLTKLRAVPGNTDNLPIGAPEMIARAVSLSSQLSMPTLGRAWQILLKGIAEVNGAPNPQAALEMLLIRLAYAADLPDPGELLKRLKDGEGSVSAGGGAAAKDSSRSPEPVALRAVAGGASVAVAHGAPQSAPVSVPQGEPLRTVASLQDVETILQQGGHYRLAGEVFNYVHLVSLKPGILQIRVAQEEFSGIVQDLIKALRDVTGESWLVTNVSGQAGSPTLAQQAEMAVQALKDEAAAHPVVAKVLEFFPGALLRVRDERNNG